MNQQKQVFIATLLVLSVGIFWGIYWLPVRVLSQWGLSGAWGTAAIALATLVLFAPFALVQYQRSTKLDWLGVVSILLGGAAFALYSVGLLYGRVAIIILLWFLSPVWSTLIARYLMGWSIPRLRLIAIIVGLAGLLIMLGAGGDLPLPRGLGEWMSFVGGIMWSFSTTGIRVRSNCGAVLATFIFAAGASIAALILAPLLAPLPVIEVVDLLKVVGLAALVGGLWWGLSLIGLMWATLRLDPARGSILLMSEVLIGALSAAIVAKELMSLPEIIGGLLVLLAGLLEVWPVRGVATNPSTQAS